MIAKFQQTLINEQNIYKSLDIHDSLENDQITNTAHGDL